MPAFGSSGTGATPPSALPGCAGGGRRVPRGDRAAGRAVAVQKA